MYMSRIRATRRSIALMRSDPLEEQRTVIGICGGVGPAAGLLLHQHILRNTDNDGTDHGHLEVCHISRSNDITDRTLYLLSSAEEKQRNKLENPAKGMGRTLRMIRAAAQANKSKRIRLILGVPCNTFHAPAIWNEFLSIAKREQIKNPLQEMHLVNMLHETREWIAQIVPECKMIGILCTTGTREAGLYTDLFENMPSKVLYVDAEMQKELNETIYNKQWGLKETQPAISQRAIHNMHRFACNLVDQGARLIVMGCTEIPFAFAGTSKVEGARLIDPMVALSRALIRKAAPSRLRDMELY